MFQKIWQKFGEPEEKKAFDRILKIVHIICMDKSGEARRNSLLDLQKILLRPIQDAVLRSCYLFEDSAKPVQFDFNSAFGLTQIVLETHGGFLCAPKEGQTISIGTQTIFSSPAPSLNALKMLGEIGTSDRPMGNFQQTEKQSLLWIDPLSIGFASGDTLPISLSALNGNGVIAPREIFDINSCLKKIRYNGAHWIDENSEILGKPVFPEFGWIWEIHRKSLFEYI